MNFFLLLNTKEDILKNLGNQTVLAVLFFHESQWGPSTVWLPTVFKISFFCVQQKKEIHTGLEQHEGDRIFIFGRTIPLRECQMLYRSPLCS